MNFWVDKAKVRIEAIEAEICAELKTSVDDGDRVPWLGELIAFLQDKQEEIEAAQRIVHNHGHHKQ